MTLLTTYTHDSELQAITAPPLISTIHKSPHHPLSLLQPAVSSPAVPWQGLLTEEIVQLHALKFFLHSLPCRNILNDSYVTTDVQLASLSWNKALIWGLRSDFYYCQTFAGLLMWGALSDERTGLLFKTAVGPNQRSHSQVQVPWNSRPYSTFLDSRLPFLSPPKTRRATVEVFDPASTRDSTGLTLSLAYKISAQTTVKTQLFHYCAWTLCRRDVFTTPLRSNGHGTHHRKHHSSIVACVYVVGIT
jgi:hypothetical protein